MAGEDLALDMIARSERHCDVGFFTIRLRVSSSGLVGYTHQTSAECHLSRLSAIQESIPAVGPCRVDAIVCLKGAEPVSG